MYDGATKGMYTTSMIIAIVVNVALRQRAHVLVKNVQSKYLLMRSLFSVIKPKMFTRQK